MKHRICSRVASALLFFVLVPALGPLLLAAPRPPLPPWPESFLYQWDFDDAATNGAAASAAAFAPPGKSAQGPLYLESWNGYACNRQGRQVQPLQFPMTIAGHPTLASDCGTLRFWFNPRWTSGIGPGSEARLLDLVTGSGKNSVSWWTLRVTPDGTALTLAAQTEPGLVNLAKTRIQWQAGHWHLLALTYTPTNTVLTVDAEVVAEGPALPEIPTPVLGYCGLVLGSDARGLNVAQGQFEELTTFTHPYSLPLLGIYYRAYRLQADLGPLPINSGRGAATALATPPPPGESGSTNDTVITYPLATNGLRLVVKSWINATITLTILGGQSNAVYDLFATSELRGSNTVWTPLGQGQNSNTCSFSGQTNACATYLVAARLDSDNDGLTDAFEKLVSHSQTNNADSDHDGLPDAWEWTHFGTFSQTASGDYDHDGTSNSAEYQYRWDPNTISYQLGFANDHFAGTTLTGAVDLLGGVPVWMTCLVDSTNFAAAAWVPYQTNFTAAITNEGAHDLWVGLRGRATNDYWQSARVVRDSTPPSLTITNLPSLTVSRPLLHVKGLCPESLARITFEFTNSLGEFLHQPALITGEAYDPATKAVTNSSFACLDLGLSPGTNCLFIKAIDLAGNIMTTNLNLVLNAAGDTSAPVATLQWPAPGARLSGASFPIKGALDDDSASLQAIMVANGVTNTASALVERDGTFWFDNLALSSGTTAVQIVATDYAGNTAVTSFAVVQSSVVLTINPVPDSQLHQMSVTVTGTVGDASYAVSVNGVAATVDASGNWTVEVPLDDGGTAAFVVSAYPPADPAALVQLARFQDKPARAFVRRYDVAVAQSEKNVYHPPNGLLDPRDLGGSLWWQERVGGEKFYYIAATANSTSLLSHTVWPLDVYAPTRPGTNYDAFGSAVPVGAPVIALERCDIQGISMQGTNWAQSYARKARAQVVLFTGGKNTPGQRNLFSLGAQVTERGWVWRTADWGYPTNRASVPAERVRLGLLGTLDANGILYTALPDGQQVVITPVADNVPNQESTLPSVTKHELKIAANGTTLNPYAIPDNAAFCAGQKVAFSFYLSPPLPDAALINRQQYQWWLPPQYVNAKEEWNGSANQFQYVACHPVQRVFSRWKDADEDVSQPCTTYLTLAELLQNAATGCWWVSPGTKKVSFWYDLELTNLTAHALSTRGLLKVVAPAIAGTSSASGGVHLFLNPNGSAHALALNNTNNLGMEIKADITRPGGFDGAVFFTQLIKRSLSYSTASSSTTENTGSAWLDTATPYHGQTYSFGTSSNTLRVTLAATPGVTEGAAPFTNAIEIQDDCQSYLRFLPAGDDNIPVTLGRFDWGWHGKAVDTNTSWTLTIGNAYGPTLNLTPAFPAWKKVHQE